MKWKPKPRKKRPQDGDSRIVRLYALFPVIIDGNRIWLKWFWAYQRYEVHGTFGDDSSAWETKERFQKKPENYWSDL